MQELLATLHGWLQTLGPLAPLIAFLATILETALTPLPVLALALFNAALFGPVWGFLITWLGSITGALLIFYLARTGRRLSRWQPKGRFAAWEAKLGQNGFRAVFIGRLTALPSSVVNLLAGASSISPLAFLAGTALGKLPATLLYTFAGARLVQSKSFWGAVIGLAVLVVLGQYLVPRLLARYRARPEE